MAGLPDTERPSHGAASWRALASAPRVRGLGLPVQLDTARRALALLDRLEPVTSVSVLRSEIRALDRAVREDREDDAQAALRALAPFARRQPNAVGDLRVVRNWPAGLARDIADLKGRLVVHIRHSTRNERAWLGRW